MTDSTYTDLAEARAESTDEGRRTSQRLRPHAARVVAEAGRALLVWLALAVVCSSQAPLTDQAIAAVTIAATVWLVCIKATSSPDVLLFGRILAHAWGAILGLFGAVLLNGTSIGLQLSPLALAGAAVGVMATTAIWDAFADVVLIARRRVLFVGSDAHDVMLPEDLGRCRQLGFEIVRAGVPAAPGAARPGSFAGVEELERVVEAQEPDIVVLTDEASYGAALDRLLETRGLAREARANLRVASFASFIEYAFGRVPVDQITPAWFLGLLHPRQRVYTRFAKRAFDICVSLLGLILAAPAFVVLALVCTTTPGPIIYRQTRVGEGGARFRIYKFRTMGCDAEQDGPAFSGEVDARLCRIGGLMRRTHVDELPQLWNVLRGEMSIVGPRPERPEFIDTLEAAVPFWNRRLLVKPGITGWAQVQCGYQSDCQGMARKLSYDLWYLRHRSLLVDLGICLATFVHVLSRPRTS